VCRHRLVLSYEALADDVTPDALLAHVLERVHPPRVVPRQDAVPGRGEVEPHPQPLEAAQPHLDGDGAEPSRSGRPRSAGRTA